MDLDPFLGEIGICAFAFPPKNWAFCNGQLLPINQNQPLFSLLGTTWGGDGRVNFALPDLRGRVLLHGSSSYVQGERGGEEAHTLTIPELPTHTHFINANSAPATGLVLTGAVLSKGAAQYYRNPTNLVAIKAGSLSNVGGSQPHNNMQPFLGLTFCIALFGIFPSTN